jgi:hypothetical protein
MTIEIDRHNARVFTDNILRKYREDIEGKMDFLEPTIFCS